ncbi:MAG: hypothetical protein ACXVA0_20745 [Mucilaginibacter sp.]
MPPQDIDINDPKTFEIDMEGQSVQITIHKIKAAKVFHLVYPSRRPDLNITVAINNDGEKFWTSMPEGRQEEAELAGKLIAAYLREYRRNQACVIITDKKLAAPSLFD